jgi:choice-of-anchor C domain-containing protein
VAAVLGLVATALAAPPALTAASAATTNLIVNGSFESPSIWQSNLLVEYDAGSTAMPGWTVGGNSVDLTGKNYWEAEDGDQSLDLSGSAPGSVSQTVSTTPGANYTLTWYMAGNTNCGQPVKTMHVLWNGTLIDSPSFNDSGDSNTSMGWIQQQINVTATGTSSVVEFADATPDMSECGAALDNVSLVPTGPIVSGYHTTKCIDDSNDSSANDTPVVMWDCNGSAEQNWTIEADGTIRTNGKCMDIYRDEKTNNAPVELWTCTGGANQQWQATGGTLVNPVSGKCLDDPRFNTTDGTQLEIYTCNGGLNQKWNLP